MTEHAHLEDDRHNAVSPVSIDSADAISIPFSHGRISDCGGRSDLSAPLTLPLRLLRCPSNPPSISPFAFRSLAYTAAARDIFGLPMTSRGTRS